MSEREQFEVQWSYVGDGSGDVFIKLSAEMLERTGLTIGTTLVLDVIDGVTRLHRSYHQPRFNSASKLPREKIYDDYRRRLADYLEIPAHSTDQAIHEFIEVGFTASLTQKLFLSDIVQPEQRNGIISARALTVRLSQNQRLSPDESDRLFRVTHIVSMAEAVFGDTQKARRWLSKPKARLSGKSPNELASTLPGTRLVEEMLIQVSEGFYN